MLGESEALKDGDRLGDIDGDGEGLRLNEKLGLRLAEILTDTDGDKLWLRLAEIEADKLGEKEGL